MWDIRYRPLLFSEVLGQEGPVQILKSRLVKGTALDKSYIFSGGHGQGKTTLARILARAMLCQDRREDGEPCNKCSNCLGILNETSQAFLELDAASRGNVETIRAIVDDLPFVVPGAPRRVYLFDEAHQMTRAAQDVLLKPIEQKELVAILCTTEPEKIRSTIFSRCEEHTIRKITREEILARMKWVLEQEKVEYEEDAVLTVIDMSGGHARDVLKKLETIAQLGPVTSQAVKEHLNLAVVSTYYQVLLSLGEPAKAVQLIEQACDRVGPDEAAAGLAESAMNSYRLANGMFAEFVYVDRGLAQQLHSMYGDQVVQLAEHFLRSKNNSRTSLICDVVRCAQGVPSQALVSTPVVIKVVAPVAPPPAPVAEAQPIPSPTPQPTPAPIVVAPVSPAKVPEPAATNGKSLNGCRPDGIGGMGSADPYAKTEDDIKAVPEKHPRRRGQGQATVPKADHGQEPSNPIPTPQWRREFAAFWKQRGLSEV